MRKWFGALYEKENGSSISLDALLSQAGIPPDEVLDMLPDDDEPRITPEQKKAEALKSAKALADLPGMPGFLKPTRTSLAAEAARAGEEKKHRKSDEATATATVDAAGSNGQGFKVTVMVSPDDETSAEAAALRESATADKPEPVTFGSPYGNASGVDARFYPQSQSAGSGFGAAMSPSMPFDGPADPLSAAPLPADPFGSSPNPSVPFDARSSIPLAPEFDSFGAPAFAAMPAPEASPSVVLPAGSDAFGGPGAIVYDMPAPTEAPFAPPAGGYAPFAADGQPPRAGDGLGIPANGVPLTDDEAAAQAAAAQAAGLAAQNAAMVDAMAQYGPDAIPEDQKKRFFGKKKRERAAKRAAEEAAAFAAATAAAAAEAAAAEEAARHQPTAYIPTMPPQFGNTVASSPAPSEGYEAVGYDSGAMASQPPAPVGAPQIPMGMDAPMGPSGDMSGYDQFTSAMPVAGAQDSSMTTGMPAVGSVPMLGSDGSFFSDTPGMASGYDGYGYPAEATGVTPEGMAALEAMRSEMNDASDSHAKLVKRVKIIVASVVGVIVAALITFIVLVCTNVISLDDLGIHINNEAPQSSSASVSSASSNSLSYHSKSSSSSSASSSSASSSAGTSAGGGSTTSLAGDEIYHYTLTTIDGEHPAVTEVVTYGSDGICIQTAMDAVFSTATAAQAFVERVRSDYGANFLAGSVDGTTAHVVVNMERAKLTREGYEKALRDVVDDLEIERLA